MPTIGKHTPVVCYTFTCMRPFCLPVCAAYVCVLARVDVIEAQFGTIAALLASAVGGSAFWSLQVVV